MTREMEKVWDSLQKTGKTTEADMDALQKALEKKVEAGEKLTEEEKEALRALQDKYEDPKDRMRNLDVVFLYG